MRALLFPLLCSALVSFACDSKPEAKDKAPEAEAASGSKSAPEEKPPAQAAYSERSAHPDEACFKVLVVSHTELEETPEGITRDKAAAKARADKLRGEVSGNSDFVAFAVENSDEIRSTKKRAGAGTFTREKWPERYAPLMDPVLGLELEELSGVVETPIGFAFAKRCPIDKVHTRHILIRYKGAERASEEVEHSKEEAKALAEKVRAEAAGEGADFAALAEKYGEDGTAKKGGDLGAIGRGMFVTAYEDVAWKLAPGELSPVVEGPFGFHVILREASDAPKKGAPDL